MGRISFVVPKRLELIRLIENNSTYGIHDAIGIKLLNKLRVDFSYLREHKLRHNFVPYELNVPHTFFYDATITSHSERPL